MRCITFPLNLFHYMISVAVFCACNYNKTSEVFELTISIRGNSMRLQTFARLSALEISATE